MACVVMIQRMQSQTAEAIINKHIAVIGGYEKIKAIKTIIFETVSKYPDHVRNSKSFIIHDSAIHTDNINSNGQNGYGIVTKTEGWTFDATTNKMKKKSKQEVNETQDVLDLHGPLVVYKEKGNRIEYLGKEIIDSSEYLKLRVVKHNKNRLIYFFDSTYLVFRVLYLPATRNEYIVEYTYQSVEGGYQFIHKLKHLKSGVETVYKYFIINPEIDRLLFLPHNVNKRKQYH